MSSIARRRSSGAGAGVRVLRDPFSAKRYILFYAAKRVGDGVQHFEAIKLLKFAVN
jgi:HK97 family phage major capsid protein